MADPRQPEIEVGLTGKGAEVRPEWVELKGNREKVDAVLASWAEGGQGPSGRSFTNRLNRTYFRVRTAGGSVYEIAHELPENRKSAARWVLVQQLQGGTETAPASPAPESRPRTAAPKRTSEAKRQTSAAKPKASKGTRAKPRARRAAKPKA
jgi:hypothetical protein